MTSSRFHCLATERQTRMHFRCTPGYRPQKNRNRIALEKLSINNLVKKFRAFYGTQISLQYSEKPALGTYPVADKFSTQPPFLLFITCSNIILPPALLLSGFPTEISSAFLTSRVRDTYSAFRCMQLPVGMICLP